jgi:hypothetical protein
MFKIKIEHFLGKGSVLVLRQKSKGNNYSVELPSNNTRGLEYLFLSGPIE